MTPRLILLTGPAANEVADVLRKDSALFAQWGINCTKRALTGSDPFEVRDYYTASRAISDQFCGCKTVTPEGIKAAERRVAAMARAVCSLPGGEEWLVGLVLPLDTEYCVFPNGMRHDRKDNDRDPWPYPTWTCKHCRERNRLPARLAILAPTPPPLLEERVRSWGGEVWFCSPNPGDVDSCHIQVGGETGWGCYFPTWPEAVRAALGEA